MALKRSSLTGIAAVALLMAMSPTLVPQAWAGSKYKVLHAFGKGEDGAGLWGSLVFDREGRLYGTTSGGGAYGYGTVFQLKPTAGGKWTERVLKSFKNNDPDGDDLNGSLILDAAGKLYGTTSFGGRIGIRHNIRDDTGRKRMDGAGALQFPSAPHWIWLLPLRGF